MRLSFGSFGCILKSLCDRINLLRIKKYMQRHNNIHSAWQHCSYISLHCTHIWGMHWWLTSPSQLLIATEASGMSLTSPVKTQSPWIRSLAFSEKSSCHSTKAPGATSLLLALRRRCSSFPNTVTLKNRRCDEVTLGISGTLRATLLLLPRAVAPSLSAPAASSPPSLPLPAETTWERYRPRESVLNGTIRPYSLSFPESFSDETDVKVSSENNHRAVTSLHERKVLLNEFHEGLNRAQRTKINVTSKSWSKCAYWMHANSFINYLKWKYFHIRMHL